MKRTATLLAVVRAREALIKERLKDATNPNTIERLELRLERVQAREQVLVDRLAQLKVDGLALEKQAGALAAKPDDWPRKHQP